MRRWHGHVAWLLLWQRLLLLRLRLLLLLRRRRRRLLRLMSRQRLRRQVLVGWHAWLLVLLMRLPRLRLGHRRIVSCMLNLRWRLLQRRWRLHIGCRARRITVFGGGSWSLLALVYEAGCGGAACDEHDKRDDDTCRNDCALVARLLVRCVTVNAGLLKAQTFRRSCRFRVLYARA